MKVKWSVVGVLFFAFTGGLMAQNYEEELLSFRQQKEGEFKAWWLPLAGLFWLQSGGQLVGSQEDALVKLPLKSPKDLGVISLDGEDVSIVFHTKDGVLLDGNPVSINEVYHLIDDSNQKPSLVSVGSVKFVVIKRTRGLGIRVRDYESSELENFKGCHWFEPKKEFVFKGVWRELPDTKPMPIQDVTGYTRNEEIHGYVEFTAGGSLHTLYPIMDGDHLLFVFKDQTNGKETYSPGRFLKGVVESDGVVTLDFNKAVSPPCAYSKFATCPLPPKENWLPLPIPAGQKTSP